AGATARWSTRWPAASGRPTSLGGSARRPAASPKRRPTRVVGRPDSPKGPALRNRRGCGSVRRMTVRGADDRRVEKLEVATYRVPTDQRESDGTLEWDHTDVVVLTVASGGSTGTGWSYG